MAEVETVKIEATNGKKPEDEQTEVSIEAIKAEVDREVEEKNNQADLTKLELDIIRQIEYYFSENNLRRDKFLISKVAESDEGWVDISVLLTFNRLKTISDDAAVIAEAVKKSNHGTVQVSEDNQKLRRHPENPLPEFNESRRKELQARTAYAKGFPLDSTLTILIDYFHENFENVEQVQMRKYFEPKSKNYLFKGSVFVVFKTRENADEFVNKPELKYKEKDLLRYTQAKYIESKKKEREEFDKKKKAKKESKEPAAEDRVEFALPKSAVVHFAGAESEITREDIKASIAEIDSALEVAFINFQKGDKDGDLRFNKENDGSKLMEKLAGGKVKSWKSLSNL